MGNCKLQKTFQESEQRVYYLDGCEKMEVRYNPQNKVLQIAGSLPYYLNGHNFAFTRSEFEKAIEIIDNSLGGVGLWGAVVNKFENGVIIPVDLSPKEYIARHSAKASTHLSKVLNEKYGGKFMMWQKEGEDIKLYDAVANMLMKQGLSRREAIRSAGWNPKNYYLKCEVRYTKPDKLNKNKPLILEYLQNESFLDMLKENLIEQYQLLSPAKALVFPSDKKNFSTLDAVLFTLAETLMNEQGLSLLDVKKQVYSIINQAQCLTKADKDARKAQVKKALERLEESPESKWDLKGKIETALRLETD